tara:strand:+ start:4627 stop:5184 length:558 start_codon:yes stop_codon:yes gene_type:complete
MASKKLKFKSGDQGIANKKAPLYLRKRQENGELITIVTSLGEGKYSCLVGPNEDRFDIQSSFLDIVEVSASGVTKEQFEDAKATLIANEKSSAPVQPTVSQKVQSFIDSQKVEISKIQEKIKPQLDQLTERAIISALAAELNLVPSPNVFKLMNHLLEISPDLGNLETQALYKKAEGILESSLAK